MQELRYRREIIPNRNHLHSEQILQKAPCCPGIQQKKPTKLKVLCCTAFSPEFDNIIKGCILDILPPPPGEDNKLGEWVMGVSQPVLLLDGEFEYI